MSTHVAPTHPLGPALAYAVPLEIAHLHAQGGPTEQDWQAAREYAQPLAEHGDELLYGGVTGKASALFVMLVHALAVEAFLPGGANFAGMQWEATAPAQERGHE